MGGSHLKGYIHTYVNIVLFIMHCRAQSLFSKGLSSTDESNNNSKEMPLDDLRTPNTTAYAMYIRWMCAYAEDQLLIGWTDFDEI